MSRMSMTPRAISVKFVRKLSSATDSTNTCGVQARKKDWMISTPLIMKTKQTAEASTKGDDLILGQRRNTGTQSQESSRQQANCRYKPPE